MFIAIIILYIIVIRRRISVSLTFVGEFLVVLAGAFAIAIAGVETLDGAFLVAFLVAIVGAGTFVIAIAIAGAFAIAIAGDFAMVIAIALAGVGVGAGTVIITTGLVGSIVKAGVSIRAIGYGYAVAGEVTRNVRGDVPMSIAVCVATAGNVVSTYIAWQAMKGDKKYAFVRNIGVTFAAIGGTSFCSADLTDADFTEAQLKSTDLRKAKLIRTCFLNTKLLDRVRPGNSYLQYSEIRQLILTGQGQDKDFDRFDLRGINLKGAFLSDASFIGTDLSEACLQDADLSRAKLVQTQLDNTDFTGAALTGAFIEDWNITHETNFCGVKCEYVYMRFPTKENPNPLRKPDNNAEVFADGEFGDFIQPIFDTLDLYHNQGVDPRAIAISFKELAENNPDAELGIVAMEKRGEDKFLLRAKTIPEADKSELSAEYFETYNQIKGLPENQIQLLLAEKDNQIRRLENMVMTALERPSFYSSTSVEKVDNMTNQQSGTSQNMSGGTMYGGMQAAQGDNSNQTMDTNVVSPEQKRTLADAAKEIQALLEQLDTTYSTDTTKGKMALATEAIAQIDSNPTLTARILSALKVGSVKAFEQFLNHPAASFVIGALEDWQKTKESLNNEIAE